MSGTEAVLTLLWFAAVAVFFVWLKRRKARKRRETEERYEALGEPARSRGWTYEERVPSLINECAGSKPSPGNRGGASGHHVVTGAHRSFPCRALEHLTVDHDVEGDGPSTTTVWSLRVLPLTFVLVVSSSYSKYRMFRSGTGHGCSRRPPARCCVRAGGGSGTWSA